MPQAHMALGAVGKGNPQTNKLCFLGPKAVQGRAVLLR